ncbi:MAG: T9SS type A sorting domain-containing protein [Bacteroidota bacterium]
MRYTSLFFLLSFACCLSLQAQIPANCSNSSAPKVLIAGDSWAQFMGDDGVYDDVFDAYGFSDHYFVTETLGAPPSPPYTGTAYAVSGSEARQWVDRDEYAYIDNMVQALQDNPEITTVILSIGGNDILAAKSDGGWYKDMDLDNSGSEEALFNTILANTQEIIDAALEVRPNLRVIISSYEYPNFDVEFGFCWIYACPKRDDLSRDPVNDLITNEELNQMMITVEEQRQMIVGGQPDVEYDNSIGLMHHIYGDGISGPGVLPAPEGTPPYAPGGNPVLPTLRQNFRIFGDPIHLDADGYDYKVRNQADNFFFNEFRGSPQATFYSEGGSNDGWVDVEANNISTSGIRMGDDGGFFTGTSNEWRGILSFNTASLPDNAMVTGAVLYLTRSGAGDGSNPYTLNDRSPKLDIKSGSFGNPAVELSDGTAPADGTDVGCFHGTVLNDNDITRIDIDPNYLSLINNQGLTQFRLYFDVADWSDNYINYFDGSEDGVNSGGQRFSGRERSPIVYHEKTIMVQDEDGNAIEQTIEVPALAALGVSDIVGTTAPFLDLTYVLGVPVELLSFTADPMDQVALLRWTSTNEENFANYELERSTNGKDWLQLSQLEGKGEGALEQYYSYVDERPLRGTNFYRLKMNDLDGSFSYSAIRQLTFSGEQADWLVYPNPFKQEIWLQSPVLGEGPLEIKLTDVLGRTVKSWSGLETQQLLHLSLDAELPAGSYYLQIGTATQTTTIKLLKE